MKRGVIVSLSLVGLAGFILLWMHLGKKDPPNVLLIVLDAARADHFSCYGYDKPTTPHIDSLAKNGVVFLNHHSNATFTRASIPKMFFSRYYSRPVFGNTFGPWGIKREERASLFLRFDDEQIMLPRVLSQHGYKTVMVHDHVLFQKDTILGRAFAECDYVKPARGERGGNLPNDQNIIGRLEDWIHHHQDEKFFAYCHIMSPHKGYPAKSEDREFLSGIPDSLVRQVRDRIYDALKEKTANWSQEEIRVVRGLYNGNLKHSDLWIGRLIEKLGDLSLLDETVIIITSDHGENLGEHHRVGHGGLPWDTVTHVPFIVYYPRRIPAGVRVTGMSESVDLMPTILDLCDIQLPPGKTADGTSLMKFIADSSRGKRAVFTTESVRTKDYKYILRRDLLYCLQEDPEETKNISPESLRIKNILTTLYKNKLDPLKARYQNAKREASPDYPFFLAIHDMRVTPAYDVKKVSDQKNNPKRLLEGATRFREPWIKFSGRHFYGLVRMPRKSAAGPIKIKARIPNGEYELELLVGIQDSTSSAAVSSGLTYRFDPGDSFSKPKEPLPLEEKFHGFNCYYFGLGTVEIRDTQFYLELEFSPDTETIYLFNHIKYTPRGVGKSGKIKRDREKDVRKKLEQLKTLGYL